MVKANTPPAFSPRNDLRFLTEYFLHEEKVVGERQKVQYRSSPGSDYWYDVPTSDKYTTLSRLTSLEHYNVTMRPGVKEQIEELKAEEDDD